MKLTRRQLAAALAARPFSQAVAGPQGAPPRPAPEAELAAARERLKANAETVARVAVPMATEPAFQFKA